MSDDKPGDASRLTPINRSNLVTASMLARAASAVRELVAPTPQPAIPAVPLLMLDVYWQDLAKGAYPGAWHRAAELTCAEVYGGQDVAAARSTRAYHGAVLKATEGTSYYATARDWFIANYRAARAAGGDRLGDDWWVGAYHYLRFRQSGARQARFYLDTVARAGGFGPGAVRPVVDIEFGGEDADNRKASRQQVVDCANEFTETVRLETGLAPILYGGSALSALRIKDHLGCSWLWPAAYTRGLKSAEATSIGWKMSEVVMWQYTDGTKGSAVTLRGTELPIGVPPTASGLRAGAKRLPLDCSVVVVAGGMRGARAALTGIAQP